MYVFKRHKQTGRKTIVAEDMTIDDARELCSKENTGTNAYYYEFTSDIEYTKNGGKSYYE